MNIIKATPNLDKKTIYQLTRGADTQPMKSAAGVTMSVEAFAIYEDDRADGKGTTTVTAIKAADGSIYATNSETFRREFDYITELMEDEEISIKVVCGTTKNDREYVTCTLV